MPRIFAALVSIATVTLASTSFADEGYIRAQASYMSSGSGTGSITTKTTRTLVDFGGGWIHSSGATVGLLYATESATYSSGLTSDNRTSFGPTIGYMKTGDQGPYVLATYFMTSTWTNYKGNGYEVDLGYKIPVRRVSLAVQLSYKSFSYNEFLGSKVDPPYMQEYFDPYFVLFVSL